MSSSAGTRKQVCRSLEVACTLAAFLAFAGCSGGSSSTPVPGNTCGKNSDCAQGLTCSFGRCQSACEEARDCPTGQQCVKNASGINSCLLPASETCNYSSQCPLPLVCAADSKCRNQCLADRDCATATQKCVLPDGVCAEPDAIGGNGSLINAVVDAGASDLASPPDTSPDVAPDVSPDSPIVQVDAPAADRMPDVAISPPDAADVAVASPDTAADVGLGDAQSDVGSAQDAALVVTVDARPGMMDSGPPCGTLGQPCCFGASCKGQGVECSGGTCSCGSGLADCNLSTDDGCEVTLNGNDILNCGRCGRDCLGAACTEGLCGMVPVVSGAYIGGVFIACDDADLFVLECGMTGGQGCSPLTLSRMSLAGGMKSEIYSAPFSSFLAWVNPTSDSSRIYFAAAAAPGYAVFSMAKVGGDPTQVGNATFTQIYSLAAGVGVIYIGTPDGLVGLSTTTGQTTAFGPTTSSVTVDAIALLGGSVYWTVSTLGSIWKLETGTQDVSVFASGEQGLSSGIALTADRVYWASGGSSTVPRSVRYKPVSGGTVQTVDSWPSGYGPRAIAADSTYVYYSNADISFFRAPLSGNGTGEAISIALGIGYYPGKMCVGPNSLFVTDATNGSLIRIAK